MRASLALLLLLPAATLAQSVVTEGTAISPDVADDGTVVFDLLGQLWTLPPRGSEAKRIDTAGLLVQEPRFSPDSNAVLFGTRVAGERRIARIDLTSGSVDLLQGSADADGTWHPDGSRVTLSSGVDGEQDLFDHDLETGLRWRLTRLDGREFDPAWSSNGRDLLFVHEKDARFRLVLRRFGGADETLLESDDRLSSPSWRPDGSLVTYIRHGEELETRMLILSRPMLDRALATEDDLFDSPIAWMDRQRMVYAANGAIRRRDFNSWIPRDLPFRAAIPPAPAPQVFERPAMPEVPSPDRRWALRVSRVLSADGRRFLEDMDIEIDGGQIVGVAPSRERSDLQVLDFGDAWLLPGLIDASACVTGDTPEALGPLLLSLGVTTVVSSDADSLQLNGRWSGADVPGPLVLPAGRLGPITELADGSRVLASGQERLLQERWSPVGRQYADAALTRRENQRTYLSGLARPATSMLDGLLSLRQAALLAGRLAVPLAPMPNALPPGAPVIVGSGCNGIPPGLATIAEINSLAASGRDTATILAAATRDGADALAIPAGRIRPGASADLILLGADPLGSSSAFERVIAVIRNGRLHSVSGLVDKAGVEKVYN